MKQTMKKLLAVLLVMTLAIGVVQTTQGTTAQAAAKKLTKADFKFTGKYKKIMSKCLSKKKYSALLKTDETSYYAYVTPTGESSPKKCIRTNRGIRLGSTKSQVFKKYGKNELVDYKISPISELLDDEMNKKDRKLLKNDKITCYSMTNKGNLYYLYFFFGKNKVEAIAVTRNMF